MSANQLFTNIGLQGLIKLAPLQSKRIDDLTVDDVSLVADVLKMKSPVSRELFNSAIALMKGEGLNKAADLIQSPEAVKKLVSLMLKQGINPEPEETLEITQCPHCMKFFFQP